MGILKGGHQSLVGEEDKIRERSGKGRDINKLREFWTKTVLMKEIDWFARRWKEGNKDWRGGNGKSPDGWKLFYNMSNGRTEKQSDANIKYM